MLNADLLPFNHDLGHNARMSGAHIPLLPDKNTQVVTFTKYCIKHYLTEVRNRYNDLRKNLFIFPRNWPSFVVAAMRTSLVFVFYLFFTHKVQYMLQSTLKRLSKS